MDVKLWREPFVWASTSVAAVTVTLVYKYYKKRFYWSGKGIASHSSSLVRNIIDEVTKDLHHIEWERYEKYGPVYGRFDGNTPVLTIGDPALIKVVMERNNRFFINRRCIKIGDPIGDQMLPVLMDEDWRRVRPILARLFSSGKINEMLPRMHTCGNRTIDYLRVKSEADEPVDLECALGAYIVDIIACCAFGYEIDSLRTPGDPFVEHSKRFFTKGKPLKSVFAQYCPILLKIFKMALFDKQASEFFRDFTQNIIDSRQGMVEPPNDYLQALIEEPRESQNPGAQIQRFITDEETISQCVLFFMAGYDTNLSLLQVTMYHLAMNQDIQDRLYDEIMEFIGDEEIKNKKDFLNMKYLERVIKEGLRLASSCVRMERTCTTGHHMKEDYKLDFFLEEGTLISLPFYCLHHDPKHWPEPHKFDPERFTPAAERNRPFHSYLPFGRGPRMCVAQEFARTEAKLGLVKILKVFRVVPCEETQVPIKYTVKLAQLVPEPVILKFVYR